MAQGTTAAPDVGVGFAVCVVAGVALGDTSGVGVGVSVVPGGWISPP